MVSDIDRQWQADIIDFQKMAKHNHNARYILTVRDVLSKYAEALKDKTGTSVTASFKHIFTQGRVPAKLQTDAGTEFLNTSMASLLKKHSIVHFLTHTEVKASVVKHFNRTLKTKIWRYFTALNTRRYVDVLQSFEAVYNASHHRTIRTAPINLTPQNALKTWHRVYGHLLKTKKAKDEIKRSDHVRIFENERRVHKRLQAGLHR